jgi:hypothetical protein
MYNVGEEVVVMSFPGRFRIIATDGRVLTLENDTGVQKRVLVQSVRNVPARDSEQSES